MVADLGPLSRASLGSLLRIDDSREMGLGGTAVRKQGSLFCENHSDTYPAIDPATNSDLKGRSVFITGASKGIGRVTAISYAKAGASKIAIAARSDLSSLEPELRSAAKAAGKPEPSILVVKLDVQDRKSVQKAADETEKAFGRLDILINNAGYLKNFTRILDSDENEYWKTWEINYRGVYWVTKSFLPLLIKTSDGLQTIVNVSSVGAHSIRAGGSGYRTSKNALLRLTEFICVEYAEKGVVAYAVHPGGVMTELSSNMPKDMHGVLGDKPELAADAIAFLTQEKRTWLAGRYVSRKWDMSQFLGKKDEIVEGDKLKMRLVV